MRIDMLLCIIWQAWHSCVRVRVCVRVCVCCGIQLCLLIAFLMMECLDEAKMNYESKECERRSARLESDQIQCPA